MNSINKNDFNNISIISYEIDKLSISTRMSGNFIKPKIEKLSLQKTYKGFSNGRK